MPSDISAAYRLLAEGFEQMRQVRSGEDGVLDDMIELLLRESEQPPKQVEGGGQDFLDRECCCRLASDAENEEMRGC